jgi:hypothetical protein
MAARAEDLLPVEYFHVVFTLPAEIARIALLDRHALTRQHSDRCVHLLAAQKALVLQPLREGQQLGVHRARAESAADRSHRPLHNVEECLARVQPGGR